MPFDLLSLLRSRGPLQAGELLRLLEISRPTLMRQVRAAGTLVVARGRARRTTYAARRALRGSSVPLPLYRIGLDGNATEIARLDLTHPDGCAVEFQQAFGWPLDERMQDGWFDGLPYPLQDMRPQGFLGRHFARRHSALLQVDEDPSRWSDDDALHALTLLGDDTPGNLLLGETACERWLDQLQRQRQGDGPVPLGLNQALNTYPDMAEAALSGETVGSSAGGEFPKFTAVREMPNGPPTHVIVKFSGHDTSPSTQRWASLLVCEQLAAQVTRDSLGIRTANTRILQAGGHTFLEVERFDRHGALGRSAVASWSSIQNGLFGQSPRPWPEAAQGLHAQGLLSTDDRDAVARQWHFGQLIGNTDMHDGNLAFTPVETAQGVKLTPTPTYDMLPMLYAPVRGMEMPQRAFSPRLPLPGQETAWSAAAVAAVTYWQQVASDGRVGEEMRRMAQDNRRSVAALLT